MAQQYASTKIGVITTVNSDHLLVQCLNENDIIRVDRYPFVSAVAVLIPYYVGETIVALKVKTPRVTDYPWIDMNVRGRQQIGFYVRTMGLNIPMIQKSITARMFIVPSMALNIPMITKAISARSCSISLPLSDTFTDTNGTLLSAHYMDAGCGWTAHVGSLGNWSVQSNKIQHDGTNDGVLAVTDDTDGHDVQISCTVGTTATTVTLSVHNRALSGNNDRWTFSAVVNTASATSDLRIVERNGGATTIRATSIMTIAMGDNLTLRFSDNNPGANDLLGEMSGDRTGSVTYNSSLHAGNTYVGFQNTHSGAITTKTLIDSFVCEN